MINSINGTIKNVQANKIIIETSFFGFDVSVPNESVFNVNQEATVYIYFHWNQENGPSLYGFTSQLEKSVFSLIVSCSGIGPRIGLTVLANMQPQEFLCAITTDDKKLLSSVPGIGLKKAEQIILQLKDKAQKLINEGGDFENKNLTDLKNISEVLQSLNYSRTEVSQALQFLREKEFQDVAFDQQLRKALSFLAKLK